MTKSTIIDSIVELRFDSNMPSQVLVGLLFQKFDNILDKVEDQPILQLPSEIRQSDSNLKLQPTYRLIGDELMVSVGDGLIGVSVVIDRKEKYYPGWKKFKEIIDKVIEFMDSFTVASEFKKVDVRYINYFETEGVIGKTNTQVKISDKSLIDENNVTLFFERNEDKSKVKVQLASKANVKSRYLNLDGSIVDISATDDSGVKFENIIDSIEKLHNEVEDLFFDLVKPEYLPEGVTKRER